MTAALVISILLNVIFLVTVVALTVVFSRTLTAQVSLTDRIHARTERHIDSLLNRIMAADWRAFRESFAEDYAEEGGQILPTPPSTDEDEGEFLLTQLSDEELRRMANERQLLIEDFPDHENR